MVQAIEESGCPVITIPQETYQHAQTGRQEWMTVIKCVSVAGAKIIPYIILKGKNGVPGWLPQYLLAGWMFPANKSGCIGTRCAVWNLLYKVAMGTEYMSDVPRQSHR